MAKRDKGSVNTVKLQKIILAVALATALGMTGMLATISVSAAVFALGFTLISFMFLYERNRRDSWEGGIEKAIETLGAAHDILGSQVSKNSKEIQTLGKNLIKSKRTQQQAPIALTERIPAEIKSKASSAAGAAFHGKSTAAKTKSQQQEKRTIKVAPAANDEHPSYYNSLSDTVVRELVEHAVHNKEVKVFMQPVMRLPEQTVRGYEVFSRVRSRPGQYIPAQRYIGIAKAEKNVINSIDHMLLMQCLEHIKSTDGSRQNKAFFINITDATLKNRLFMEKLLNFVSRNRALAPRIIFEVSQSDFKNMGTGTEKILKGLGKLGCALSLDHVQSLDFDIHVLQDFKVRFVKIDAADLISKSSSDIKINALWRIKRKLESNGIGMIAQKIETPEMMEKLAALDLHYGQGFLFGKPAPKEVEDSEQSAEQKQVA